MTISDLHPLVALAHTIDLSRINPLTELRLAYAYSIGRLPIGNARRNEAVAACLLGEYILFQRLRAQEALILKPHLFPLPPSSTPPLSMRAREPKQ